MECQARHRTGRDGDGTLTVWYGAGQASRAETQASKSPRFSGPVQGIWPRRLSLPVCLSGPLPMSGTDCWLFFPPSPHSPALPLWLLLVARCGAHMQHLELFVALIVASPLADYGKS